MQVVATAGHVDHGKSALVRAITGMEPDRWAEERRRGLTIDLGFAWAVLPSGAELAIVDVPGHARFLGNMLAGVGPVPAVVFVVAADAGWQAQSSEHLAALDAFGVRSGLLVVTRSDLADPAAATAAAGARIRRTTLGGVPAVAVSSVTGAGLDELRGALDRLVAALPPADPTAPVRIWVDRSFPVSGAGTVVTGTLGAGTLRRGDELELAPGGRLVRVRGLQTLGRRVDTVAPVARVGINLRGVHHQDVRRGQALLTPASWPVVALVDIRVPADPPLPVEVVVHAGSAAVSGRLRPLGRDTARLTLGALLPLRTGERLLLRDPGRPDRLAGVEVLDVAPPELRRRGAAAARAAELAETPDAGAEVRRRGAVRRRDLAAAGRNDRARDGRPVGDWVVAPERLADWAAKLERAVDRVDPLHPGLTREAARRLLQLPDIALLDAVVAAADGLRLVAGRVVRPGARPQLPAPAAAAVDRVRARLAAAPFAAPEAGELAEAGLSAALLAAAEGAGLLARVGGVVLLPGWPEEAVARLARLPAPFATSAARQALGTSRRVAVPVLEALDAAGRTRRIDGVLRVLVPPVSA